MQECRAPPTQTPVNHGNPAIAPRSQPGSRAASPPPGPAVGALHRRGFRRGERLQDILSGSRSVAEGVRTTRSARELAARHDVEMPIVEGVYRILYEDGRVQEGIDRLLERPLKAEEEAPKGR